MTDIEYRKVPSFPRYSVGSDGSVIGPSGRHLRPCPDTDGYPQVLVYPGDGAGRQTRKVHTLVCEAFHGRKPSPRHQVAHWDGDYGNNTPANLRWATAKENIADKVRHGRVSRTSGEIDGMHKLGSQQVLEIRQRCSAGAKQRDLAMQYGVKQPTISNIVTRTTWSHLE